MFEVSVSAAFEAAHYIQAPNAPTDYRTVHGHSFVVTATMAAERPNGDGWVIDLGDFETRLKAVLARLDHRLLNDVPGLGQPTFENILLFIDRGLREDGLRPSRLEIERPILRQRAVFTPPQ